MSDLEEKLRASRDRHSHERRQLLSQWSALRAIAGTDDISGQHVISRRMRYGARGAERENKFNPLYVEPLLQQAVGLVERVLAEEPTYRQLRVDQTNLRIDLDEFQTLQAINDDEVQAGLFQLGFWEANSAVAF
jgi:hypothetical protein